MIRFIAVALLFACIPAYATSVGVAAVGESFTYSDPGGHLPFSEPPSGTLFTLAFTYDSETPDVNGDPRLGVYAGAISAMSLTVGNLVIPSWPDNALVMLDGYGANPNTDIWLAYTFIDTPLTSERFGLQLLDTRGTALSSDAIVPPSWPGSPWNLGAIYYEVQERATANDPFVTVASMYSTPTSITVVPLPGAAWLLGTSCLSLMGAMRRKVIA
ncbi:MAG: hypothetical protein Q8N51_19830 [Gammaproteobacteria bacterium]|nr:hypothetical protein [Gammaproteobacteria bacterium]